MGNKIASKDDNKYNEESLDTVELSYNEASSYLRLTYSLTYANIQGRTFRNKHLCLLDTHHRSFFTTRHLIVGVSRATHGRFVHMPTEQQEDTVLRKAIGNVSEDFLNFIDNQEHLAMPEPEPEEEQHIAEQPSTPTPPAPAKSGRSRFVLSSMFK